jgi:hypothetical protein
MTEFLQVPAPGLFYFGPEHHTVPLQKTFIRVTGNQEGKINDEML